MKITIYGDNCIPVARILVIYVVELTTELHTEIFRQMLDTMPRYQPGDVIKFKTKQVSKGRYVVKRVVNYIVETNKVSNERSAPQFENEIRVFLEADGETA